ncbi:MAG: hypothetical protein KF819_25495 [Labilithrix sp.]|nr:hypothetical protein [Labilithrix sp.]
MSESINRVAGLEEFRAAWDVAKARPRHDPQDNQESADGHINIEGNARCMSAAIYTPADAEFARALEPGVRPLVEHLVDALDCITYSSCEGHPPTADGYTMRVRHVGILPRDAADRDRILAALEPAALPASAAGGGIVELRILEDVLGGDGPDLPCIDVVFGATRLDWPAYEARVGDVQAALLAALK